MFWSFVPLLGFGITALAQNGTTNTASASFYDGPAKWPKDIDARLAEVSVVSADACKTRYHLVPRNSTYTITVLENTSSISSRFSSSNDIESRSWFEHCALTGGPSVTCTHEFVLTLGGLTPSTNTETFPWDADFVTLPITAGGEKIAAVSGPCTTGYAFKDDDFKRLDASTTADTSSISSAGSTTASASSGASPTTPAATASKSGSAAPTAVLGDMYKLLAVPGLMAALL